MDLFRYYKTAGVILLVGLNDPRGRAETVCHVHMLGFMENEIHGANGRHLPTDLQIHVVNANRNTTTRVSLTTNQPNTTRDIVLKGLTSANVSMPESLMVNGSRNTRQGIRVEANDSVISYGVNRFDDESKQSTDGFLSIPIPYLGHQYFAVTEDKKAQFLVVGVFSDTIVNITLKATNDVRYKGTKYQDGNVIYDVINEYDTIQVQCKHGDLTGTEIMSSKPVTVMSGNTRVQLTKGSKSGGHLVEQLPSVDTWGLQHVTRPPDGCTYYCNLVTCAPGTLVTYNCSDGTAGSYTFEYPGSHRRTDFLKTVCLFISDKPVLVTLFIENSNTDPSMVVLPPMQEIRERGVVLHIPPIATAKKNQLVFLTTVASVVMDNHPYNTTTVDGMPGIYTGIIHIESGVHVLWTPTETSLNVTGYIYGTRNKEALSYPLVHHYLNKVGGLQKGCQQEQPCPVVGSTTPHMTTTSTMPTSQLTSTSGDATTSSSSSLSTSQLTSTSDDVTTSSSSSLSTSQLTSTSDDATMSSSSSLSTSQLTSTSGDATTSSSSSLSTSQLTSKSDDATTSSSSSLSTSQLTSTSDDATTSSSSSLSTSQLTSTSDDATMSSSSSLSTSQLTSTSDDATTSSSSSLSTTSRSCRCVTYVCSRNYTRAELDRNIKALREELLIKYEQTSRYRRSLISVMDDRTSVKVIGGFAISVLVVLGGGFIFLDITNLVDMLTRIKRNLLSR